jgi:homospermidine synthase
MEYLYKKHLKFKPGNITIMDKNSKKIEGYSNKYPTINFVKFEVTKDNYKDTINKYLGKDDVLIDLAWYISTPALLELCHEKGIHFVNTAIEAWYEDDDCKSKLPKECETLYRHQHAVRKTATEWGNKGATAVVSHGANPGWVSHAMKLSLRDWINFLIKQNSNDTNVKKAKEYLAKGEYNEAARLLNVQVIHIAERDTQISKDPKHVGEFCCTWSCTGLKNK